MDTEGKYLYMKKIAITILAVLTSLAGFAQNANDAYMFSENLYEGTARTMAMGNAFTALGGDLGSVNINPAGSAVAGYSQITLTPGITISTNTAQGFVAPDYNGSLPYFQDKIKSSTTRFAVPNIGVTLNYDTHRTSGVKNITVGFIMNKSAGWDEDIFAAGINKSTSFIFNPAAATRFFTSLGSITTSYLPKPLSRLEVAT